MTVLLDAIAGRGYPVSVLYPATTPIYRSLGWELAGGHHRAVIPARTLGAFVPADVTSGPACCPVTSAPPPNGGRTCAARAREGTAGEVVAVIGRVHERARDCGPNTRDAGIMARWLADPDLFAYLAADGFLAYRWHRGHDEILVELGGRRHRPDDPRAVVDRRVAFLDRHLRPRPDRPGVRPMAFLGLAVSCAPLWIEDDTCNRSADSFPPNTLCNELDTRIP